MNYHPPMVIQETCFRLRQRMKAAAQVPGSGMGVMVLMLLPTCSRPKKPPGASGLANCCMDPDWLGIFAITPVLGFLLPR